jgi:Flp pilus assembly protein TadD
MTAEEMQSILQQAIVHHQAGRLAQARQLYEAVLSTAPNQPVAIHHLGLIALQTGRPQLAADMIGSAARLDPSPTVFRNLAEALRAAGQLSAAVEAYRQAIVLGGTDARLHASLGMALGALARWPEARTALERSLAIDPNQPGPAIALATALGMLADHEAAVRLWERATKLAPGDISVLRSLAGAWLDAGDPYLARQAAESALALSPADAQTHLILARALEQLNKADLALTHAQRATEVAPLQWQTWQHLGALLDRLGRSGEALAPLREALRLDGSQISVRGMLAAALESDGRYEEAQQVARAAIALAPDDLRLQSTLRNALLGAQDFAAVEAEARRTLKRFPNDVASRGHLAFALLSQGKYPEGFREYEWRWRDINHVKRTRDFDQPQWRGGNCAGRTIFVHSEQGFGDVFQFVRYVPMIRQRGANVIVEVNYKLAGLIRRMAFGPTVSISGTILPRFDLHVPMGSLPSIFGTMVESIPASVPYLFADMALAERWRTRLGELGESGKFKVGLVWAGSQKPDPRRSAKLADFAPLAALSGITWIAMQSPPESDEAASPPPGMQLINLGPELRDFSETTAPILANLDLLITVDTGVAHLAGAMGIRTWVLLRESPEWRWLLDRDVTRWYPTLRLFRQPAAGDWASVMQKVTKALRILTQ